MAHGRVTSQLRPVEPRDRDDDRDHDIRHVLVISIDGMHALDFANCAMGIPGVNGGEPYCPTLAELANHGVNPVVDLKAFYPQPGTFRRSPLFLPLRGRS